jgi:hypothetical protein
MRAAETAGWQANDNNAALFGQDSNGAYAPPGASLTHINLSKNSAGSMAQRRFERAKHNSIAPNRSNCSGEPATASS